MGDLSTEPSMEEILSSIKRIIAEEGEAGTGRSRRPARPAPAPSPASEPEPRSDEVLELNHPVPQFPPQLQAPVQSRAALPEPEQPRAPSPASPPPPTSPPVAAEARPAPARPAPPAEATEPEGEPIVSSQTAAATRGSLEALSKLMVKPEPDGDGTLEGLVRDMLRPMLRDWLDSKLPEMVEGMVAREIAKITGQGQ